MKAKPLTSYLINTALQTTMIMPAAAGNQVTSDAPLLSHDVFGSGEEKVIVLHSWMSDAKSFDLVKPYLNTD